AEFEDLARCFVMSASFNAPHGTATPDTPTATGRHPPWPLTSFPHALPVGSPGRIESQGLPPTTAPHIERTDLDLHRVFGATHERIVEPVEANVVDHTIGHTVLAGRDRSNRRKLQRFGHLVGSREPKHDVPQLEIGQIADADRHLQIVLEPSSRPDS